MGKEEGVEKSRRSDRGREEFRNVPKDWLMTELMRVHNGANPVAGVQVSGSHRERMSWVFPKEEVVEIRFKFFDGRPDVVSRVHVAKPVPRGFVIEGDELERLYQEASEYWDKQVMPQGV